ncbi:MAG: hypothetical protein QNJ74_03665 [Trichodesmium sp. MO_231.B1]|nr:hypothetical protein [Trichodesmium sp. MO_231.B1]
MPVLEKNVEITASKSPIKHEFRCPNCGVYGERTYYNQLTKTECHSCDYLMITHTKTGQVVEAHAPGIYF